jgi:hypothetical protein
MDHISCILCDVHCEHIILIDWVFVNTGGSLHSQVEHHKWDKFATPILYGIDKGVCMAKAGALRPEPGARSEHTIKIAPNTRPRPHPTQWCGNSPSNEEPTQCDTDSAEVKRETQAATGAEIAEPCIERQRVAAARSTKPYSHENEERGKAGETHTDRDAPGVAAARDTGTYCKQGQI